MVRVCAFPGCFNREKAIRLRPTASCQEESLIFHTLPLHDPERLKLWLLALKRDINSPIESVRALRVCSVHFSADDLTGPTRRFLNSTAVPGQQTEVCVCVLAHYTAVIDRTRQERLRKKRWQMCQGWTVLLTMNYHNLLINTILFIFRYSKIWWWLLCGCLILVLTHWSSSFFFFFAF